MFMENLPKKGPLFREIWAQKTHPCGRHIPVPSTCYVTPPPPPGLEHQLLTGSTEGKRDRGKQRTTYVDILGLLTDEKNGGTFIQQVVDRENWKDMIVDVCNQIRQDN